MKKLLFFIILIPLFSQSQIYPWKSIDSKTVGVKNQKGKILFRKIGHRVKLEKIDAKNYLIILSRHDDYLDLYHYNSKSFQLIDTALADVEIDNFQTHNALIVTDDSNQVKIYNSNFELIVSDRSTHKLTYTEVFENLGIRSVTWEDGDFNINHIFKLNENSTHLARYHYVEHHFNFLVGHKQKGYDYYIPNRKISFQNFLAEKYIDVNGKAYFIGKIQDETWLVNEEEEKIKKLESDKVYPRNGYSCVRSEGAYFCMCALGNFESSSFPYKVQRQGDLLFAWAKDGNYGSISHQNKMKSTHYNYLFPTGKYFLAQNDKLQWGLINSDGKEIIPFKEKQYIHWFNGYYSITQGSKLQLLNAKGKEINAFESDQMDFQREPIIATPSFFFAAGKDGYSQFFSWDGQALNDTLYEDSYYFQNGIAAFKKGNDQLNYLDCSKNSPQFIARNIDNEMEEKMDQLQFILQKNGKKYTDEFEYHILDLSGKLIHKVDELPYFYEELEYDYTYYIFKRNDLYGIMNNRGEIVVPSSFPNFNFMEYYDQSKCHYPLVLIDSVRNYHYYNPNDWSNQIENQGMVDFELYQDEQYPVFPIISENHFSLYNTNYQALFKNKPGIVQLYDYPYAQYTYKEEPVFIYLENRYEEKDKSLINLSGDLLLPISNWGFSLIIQTEMNYDIYDVVLPGFNTNASGDSSFTFAYHGKQVYYNQQKISKYGLLANFYDLEDLKYNTQFLALYNKNHLFIYTWDGDLYYHLDNSKNEHEMDTEMIYFDLDMEEYLPKISLENGIFYITKDGLIAAD